MSVRDHHIIENESNLVGVLERYRLMVGYISFDASVSSCTCCYCRYIPVNKEQLVSREE